MIFLTWNVECGRATAGALEIADQVAADAVFLQEGSVDHSWKGPKCSAQVPGRGWGSAVLVRDGGLQSIAILGYSGWVTGGCWRPKAPGVFNAIYLFSMHSPTANEDEPRSGYVAESLKIVHAICAAVPSGAPLVIGGDFNFKSFGERLPNELPANEGSELDALKQFRDLGLLVAWRDSHHGLPLPQTLRWKKAPATPYHCDGFLLRGVDVRTVQCEVLSSEVVTRQSDHNPIVLWVELSHAGQSSIR